MFKRRKKNIYIFILFVWFVWYLDSDILSAGLDYRACDEFILQLVSEPENHQPGSIVERLDEMQQLSSGGDIDSSEC